MFELLVFEMLARIPSLSILGMFVRGLIGLIPVSRHTVQYPNPVAIFSSRGRIAFVTKEIFLSQLLLACILALNHPYLYLPGLDFYWYGCRNTYGAVNGTACRISGPRHC